LGNKSVIEMHTPPPDPDIFSGAALAIVVTLLVALIFPLGYHYSQPAEKRPEVHRRFVSLAAYASAILIAYLVADIDQGLFDQQRVWFVLGSSAILLLLTATLLVDFMEGAGRVLPEPAGSSLGELPADHVAVCSSSAEFARVILSVERDATSVDRMTKRVSAIFKDPDAVEAIATQRFGPGSTQSSAYRDEHSERHRLFIERLAQRHLVCREIYQRQELLAYARTRVHGIGIVLDKHILRRTIETWASCIEKYDGYHVALTEDPIPLKYQIFNSKTVVLHEAAGSLDGQRLNAIVIEGEAAVSAFQADFDNVWDRIPGPLRSKQSIIEFIEEELLPLLV
jgi:hypothetical protein